MRYGQTNGADPAGKAWRPLGAAMAAVFLLLAAGCGQGGAPSAAPEATAPEATAAPMSPPPSPPPTPEPLREAVLTGESEEEVLALLDAPALEYVDASASAYYEALARLQTAKPECVVDYTVDLGGVAVRSTDTEAVLAGADIEAGALADRLAWLPRLMRVDICDMGYSNEESLTVAERYPEKDIVWTVHFARYSVRSDITCFSTLQGTQNNRYSDEVLAPLLTYCKDLVALDLGHNAVTDLTPIGRLEKLQVLFLADNGGIADLSPLENLTDLQFLEIFMDYSAQDFTPLEKLEKMRQLNLCYCRGLKSLSFVEHMPDLSMVWFVGTGVSREEREAVLAARPDVTFYFAAGAESTGGGWRMTDENVAIRKAFTNWPEVVSFRSWDDVEYREGAVLKETFPMNF